MNSICFCHFFFIANQILNPKLPAIRTYKKHLRKIDFPLSFRICLKKFDNVDERYETLGYENAFDFFLGRSRYNKSLVGWNGHTEDGKTLGSTKGQKYRK